MLRRTHITIYRTIDMGSGRVGTIKKNKVTWSLGQIRSRPCTMVVRAALFCSFKSKLDGGIDGRPAFHDEGTDGMGGASRVECR